MLLLVFFLIKAHYFFVSFGIFFKLFCKMKFLYTLLLICRHHSGNCRRVLLILLIYQDCFLREPEKEIINYNKYPFRRGQRSTDGPIIFQTSKSKNINSIFHSNNTLKLKFELLKSNKI